MPADMMPTTHAASTIRARIRTTIRGVIAAGFGVAVLASCSSSAPGEADVPATTVFIPPTVFVVLTTPTTTTSSLVLLPLDEIQSCVDQTMYYAFVGNEFWRQAWDDLDQDETRLRANCTELATSDPATLRKLHDDWLPVKPSP
jgi:hypothetical protein